MKKSKFIRILALCIVAASLVGVVSAFGDFDVNQDGKTNVWDLQLLANENRYSQEALEAVLGGKDQLHPEEPTPPAGGGGIELPEDEWP